ncbi:hypothetical protein FGO68_gene419 [Halteria grandinella]|uniref:Uncharacterized protein n=1 Tax=Halteria grandinella TaxID=5974 RepID=A0A8J8SXD7_HALGN|nr:hypothetical protein FGO68_gene419 [Halteria grandinella]
MGFEDLGLANEQMHSFWFLVLFQFQLKESHEVSNEPRPKDILGIFASIISRQESCSEQYFKFVVNFVDRPLLLQCVISEKEHVTVLVESSLKMPCGIIQFDWGQFLCILQF